MSYISLKRKREYRRYKTFNYSTYDNPLLDIELIKEVESEIPVTLKRAGDLRKVY